MSPSPASATFGTTPDPGTDSPIGRIVRSADFVRILRTPICARSIHFALHHVRDVPSRSGAERRWAGNTAKVLEPALPRSELSTGAGMHSYVPVDDSAATTPMGVWLGAVVPKKHARRAVTRTMMKRQIRTAMAAASRSVAHGLWVVRLRAPFDRSQFTSATSDALVKVVRAELQTLFGHAVRSRPAGR